MVFALQCRWHQTVLMRKKTLGAMRESDLMTGPMLVVGGRFRILRVIALAFGVCSCGGHGDSQGTAPDGSGGTASGGSAGEMIGGMGGRTDVPAGGVPSGGANSLGGSAGTTDTRCLTVDCTDCATRAQEDCDGECRPIGGTSTGISADSQIYGCRSAAIGCTAVVTCARPPDSPETCVMFSSGCIPSGWTSSNACDLPGCPSVSP
jgi:hypothetical protein